MCFHTRNLTQCKRSLLENLDICLRPWLAIFRYLLEKTQYLLVQLDVLPFYLIQSDFFVVATYNMVLPDLRKGDWWDMRGKVD